MILVQLFDRINQNLELFIFINLKYQDVNKVSNNLIRISFLTRDNKIMKRFKNKFLTGNSTIVKQFKNKFLTEDNKAVETILSEKEFVVMSTCR